ncbi:MAG: hypothetical protein JXM73_21155 [Anaerolineae bacterium]|nr:hypothetical protein [Anaerolineae bacterium]
MNHPCDDEGNADGHNIATIRVLIRDTFTAETLSRFCHDRPLFQPIRHHFGPKFSFEEMIDALIEQCEKRALLPDLLSALLTYEPPAEGRGQTVAVVRFRVPFPRNQDFVGREADLQQLHALLLAGDSPVGVQPAGLTGMGGIGKTQLAVEYAYRYRQVYPGGIYWINAAAPLAQEFARLGRLLDPETVKGSVEGQIDAVSEHVTRHSDTLLILDNLPDPSLLNLPLGPGWVPAALPCRVLFTTRRRDLGRFRPVEVTVLPETAALALLLRHPRRREILDPGHPDHGWARVICLTVGHLPLALELASAFLGRYLGISLFDYRLRLLREGAIDTVDDTHLRPEEMPTRHEVAVEATLKTSWQALADKDARLIMVTAGQLAESEQIPIERLWLLSGLPVELRSGHPSRLERAVETLVEGSLLERLADDAVRLHPLVREFTRRQIPAGYTGESFRAAAAGNLLAALGSFQDLEKAVGWRGVDAVVDDLRAALGLCPEMDGTRTELSLLERLMDGEAYYLRNWNPDREPYYFAQRLHYRAMRLGAGRIMHDAKARLATRSETWLQLAWRVGPSDAHLLRTLSGHTLLVQAIAITPDGQRVVTGSSDKTLRVWNLETGEMLRVLRGHQGKVCGVVTTPDGTRAVSASTDGTLRVWDLETGQCVRLLEGHSDALRAVVVSPDGHRAISASEDETLRVWDLATGQLVRVIENRVKTYHAMALTPDGKSLISAARSRDLELRDLETGDLVHRLAGIEKDVRAVRVTADGRLAVLGLADGALRLWNLETGQSRCMLEGHTKMVLDVALTPDGRRAVSGSVDNTVRVWDLVTGVELGVLDGHEEGIYLVAFTPDGARIVSASFDQTLKVWDVATGRLLQSLEGHTRPLMALAVSPDGRRAVSGSSDGTARVWSLAGDEDREAAGRHSRYVFSVAPIPGKARAVSSALDGNIKVWDLASGRTVLTLRGHARAVDVVRVTPDGTRAVSGGRDRSVRVWDLATGQAVHVLDGLPNIASLVEITGDGRHVVAAAGKTLFAWHLETGELMHIFEGHSDTVRALAVSPDDRLVLSASSDGTVKVWDLVVGQALRTLTGGDASTQTVLVTPDGSRAILAADCALRVWHLETGRLLHDLAGHAALIRRVCFATRGRYLISASADGCLKTWDLESGRELHTLTGHRKAVRDLAVVPGREFAVSVSEDQTLRLWDLEARRQLAYFEGDGLFLCVTTIEHGGRTSILAGDTGGTVWAFEVVTGVTVPGSAVR